MDWELYKQELFDTGVTVFNLDHDVVENIKKFNINFQEKVNNNIINLSVQMNNQLLKSSPQIFDDINRISEMNKISSFTGRHFPKNGIFDFVGNFSLQWDPRGPGGI